MRRRLVLIVLLVFLAIALLAVVASAADWVVSGNEQLSNQQRNVDGDVLVVGNGRLTLNNVNLRFTGPGPHEIHVSEDARITIAGGTISSSGDRYDINLEGTSSISECAISQSNGISILTWRASINNCSIRGTTNNAIRANPQDSYPGSPLDISDNNITDAGSYGILITVGDHGSTDVKVVCEGNEVTRALRDGVRVTANTDKGGFFMRKNKAWLCAGHGISASFPVRVVEMRVDDCYAKNNTQDGIHLVVTCSIHLMKNLNDLTAIGNGLKGVYIEFGQTHWYRPAFKDWYVFDNVDGGIHFINFICATLENSYNVNEGSSADYTSVNTVLEVYGTTHRKSQATVSGSAYHVTSYRYLNFHATWQNGMPCRHNTIEFEDSSGDRLFYWTTDFDGWLGNHTEWDWRVTTTRAFIRHSITPFLVGGQQRLPGNSIDFDRDFEEDLVFYDSQPPDLSVDTPNANDVQAHDLLEITGSCIDAHSGAKLVQVSFDAEPVWRNKAWLDAEGTTVWNWSNRVPDGTVTIFVRAFDNANWPNGMFANVTITNVTVDTTAPNLTIIQPPPVTITNSSQITLLGTTDPDVVTLSINGEFLEFYGGTFNKPMQLNEGNNTIVIIATDYAGNIAKVVRYVTLDSIPPILHVSYPPDGLRINKKTLTMGGFTDRQGVKVKVNGVLVPTGSDGSWSHTLLLVKGPNTLLVDTFDIANNHRVMSREVIYDPDPPVINVNKPQPGDVINSSKFQVLGTTDFDIFRDQIRVNDIWIGLDGNIFDYEMTVVGDGPLNITLFAMDEAGNTKVETVEVFIDTTAPTIEGISLIDGDIVNVRTLEVSGSTEADARLFVEGNIVTLDEDGDFSTQVHLEEGENTITLTVTDTASNTRTILRRVTLDTDPPTLTFDNIAGNLTRTSKRFITLMGNTDSTATLTVSYGGVVEQVHVDANGDFSHPIIIGNNRTTEVLIRSEDYAGNVNEFPLVIKRREKEEEPAITGTDILIGLGVVALVIVIAIGTKYSLDAAYQRRLKLMGTTSSAPPAQAAPAPARGPPARPPGAPPRPGEGPARAPPRPPRPDE